MLELNVPNFENVYSTGVVVAFLKKDGSERIMSCTLNMNDIPEKYHPKNKDSVVTENAKDVNYYHVFDCEALGWRCVPRNNYTVIRNMEVGEAKKTIDVKTEELNKGE